ncbi:hypothetical protein GN956_G20606 [Arapaima gigas]
METRAEDPAVTREHRQQHRGDVQGGSARDPNRSTPETRDSSHARAHYQVPPRASTARTQPPRTHSAPPHAQQWNY